MEMLDHPGWLWGLSLIVLTMAIHATAVVMLAFVGVRIRMRLETHDLEVWNLKHLNRIMTGLREKRVVSQAVRVSG